MSFDIFSIPDNGEFEVPSSFVPGLSSGARPKTTNTSGKKKQKSKGKSKNNQSKTNHSKGNVEERKKDRVLRGEKINNTRMIISSNKKIKYI